MRTRSGSEIATGVKLGGFRSITGSPPNAAVQLGRGILPEFGSEQKTDLIGERANRGRPEFSARVQNEPA